MKISVMDKDGRVDNSVVSVQGRMDATLGAFDPDLETRRILVAVGPDRVWLELDQEEIGRLRELLFAAQEMGDAHPAGDTFAYTPNATREELDLLSRVTPDQLDRVRSGKEVTLDDGRAWLLVLADGTVVRPKLGWAKLSCPVVARLRA